MIGAEGDVEMVAAGQAVLRDVDKRPAHHTAQGVFHHAIVSQTVAAHFLGHVAPRPDCGRLILPRILASSGIPRWGASVALAPRWGASVARCAPNPASIGRASCRASVCQYV